MSTSFGSNLSISLAKQPGMQLPDSPTCPAPLPKLGSLQVSDTFPFCIDVDVGVGRCLLAQMGTVVHCGGFCT